MPSWILKGAQGAVHLIAHQSLNRLRVMLRDLTRYIEALVLLLPRPTQGVRVDQPGSTSELTWIDWEWIRNETSETPNYGPWYGEGPLPFMQVNNDRARAAGLTFRPIEDTAKDMIANLDQHTECPWGRGGFDPKTEAALLKKWHAEKG